MKPMVSIIIPVYNAEKYLQQCLDSIQKQTFNDYEVICINDGSTDSSCSIIKKYVSSDSRFKLYTQDKKNAGVARNNGMTIAKGKYYLFLDADDFFEYELLERTVNIAEKENSDIVVFSANYYDNKTNKYINAPWMIRLSHIPINKPFSSNDNNKYIFNFTNTCAWNKLFNRDFIANNNICFQDLQRSNDAYFTNIALAKAKRISICNERLVNYRTNNHDSLQGSNEKTPSLFFCAFKEIKARLENDGIYAEFRISYINLALSNCLYNLNSLKDPTAFKTLYDKLRLNIFEELGLLDIKQEDIYDIDLYKKYINIINKTAFEYLFDDCKKQLSNRQHRIRYKICVPYDKDKVKLVIYGAGVAGKRVYKELVKSSSVNIVLWVDTQYKLHMNNLPVVSPSEIEDEEFDYIIIAIENSMIINNVVDSLRLMGIEEKKILRLAYPGR